MLNVNTSDNNQILIRSGLKDRGGFYRSIILNGSHVHAHFTPTLPGWGEMISIAHACYVSVTRFCFLWQPVIRRQNMAGGKQFWSVADTTFLVEILKDHSIIKRVNEGKDMQAAQSAASSSTAISRQLLPKWIILNKPWYLHTHVTSIHTDIQTYMRTYIHGFINTYMHKFKFFQSQPLSLSRYHPSPVARLKCLFLRHLQSIFRPVEDICH